MSGSKLEGISMTIAALSTPPYSGAVGIIRISGEGAIAAAEKVFARADSKPLSAAEPRYMTLGYIVERKADASFPELDFSDGKPGGLRILDQALAVVFHAPRSFTGEDVVELHCHGSLPVLHATLSALYACGVSPAQPGEFTRRAFLNGRLDLTQAEAVCDLVSAETEEAARNAASQLGGRIRSAIEAATERLTSLRAHYCAMVDYPEEDIPPLADSEIAAGLSAISADLSSLAATFERGRVLREGIRAAIVGPPNAGKSSMLNALLGYDRAIVSDAPGTTRDMISESVSLGGLKLLLSDTAGLRSPGDEIEAIGVARSKEAARLAGIVFLVLDGSLAFLEEERALAAEFACSETPLVVLLNKSDLPHAFGAEEINAAAPSARVCRVSALSGNGLDALGGICREIVWQDKHPTVADGGMLTNLRQAEAVANAAMSLDGAARAIECGITPDAVLSDLEECANALGAVVGKNASANTLDEIFSRFCIGK